MMPKGGNEVAEEKPKQYRFVGSHAEVSPDGAPIGIGDFIELTDDQARHPFFEDLLAQGTLIGTEESSEHQQSLAERRVSRRSTESNVEGEEQ